MVRIMLWLSWPIIKYGKKLSGVPVLKWLINPFFMRPYNEVTSIPIGVSLPENKSVPLPLRTLERLVAEVEEKFIISECICRRHENSVNRLRQHHGPHPLHLPGPLADRQAAPASDRPAHSRGRPPVAPEEGRHAHHGRRVDPGFDRGPFPALGELAQPLPVGGAIRRAELRRHRILGRLPQDSPSKKPGAHRQEEVPVAGGGGAVGRPGLHVQCDQLLDTLPRRSAP